MNELLKVITAVMLLDKNSQTQGTITNEIELAENNNLMYLTLLLVILKIIELLLSFYSFLLRKQKKKYMDRGVRAASDPSP